MEDKIRVLCDVGLRYGKKWCQGEKCRRCRRRCASCRWWLLGNKPHTTHPGPAPDMYISSSDSITAPTLICQIFLLTVISYQMPMRNSKTTPYLSIDKMYLLAQLQQQTTSTNHDVRRIIQDIPTFPAQAKSEDPEFKRKSLGYPSEPERLYSESFCPLPFPPFPLPANSAS